MMLKRLLGTFFCLFFMQAVAQEKKTGAWYMYFYKTQFKESNWGIQGDVQYRNWNLGGDLEQLLLRSGVTYKVPETPLMLTLGYAHITSGVIGDSDDTSMESRIYQEALIPQKISERFLLTHRFRFEQRWVENQDFRTRYRYNLFLNVPLSKPTMTNNTLYLALYNELFINGQRDIGDGRKVEIFDRNRTYLGLGYALNDKMKFQLAWMNQNVDTQNKGQLQLSFHHQF